MTDDRVWRAKCAHASWWLVQTDLPEPELPPSAVCSYGCLVTLTTDEPRG